MITVIKNVFDSFKKNPIKDEDHLSTNSPRLLGEEIDPFWMIQ